MKRILLCSVLCAAACLLWSCAEETAPEPVSAPTEEAAVIEEEPEAVRDDLPDDLSFDGATVSVFGWTGPSCPEFFVEGMTGEVVDDAIYKRNLDVEDRLDVTLTYRLEPGNYTNMNMWMKTLSACIEAGSGDYDFAASYSMAGASMASKGYYIDLKTVDYLNFEKPWWPSSLIEEATCANKLFFCSGDISTYMTYYMYVMIFNKGLIADYNLDDPYELVLENKWTFDTLFEMASGIYEDLDGNGMKDVMDVYGYSSHAIQIDPYFYAAGLHAAEKDEEDLPCLSSDLYGEKVVDLVGKMISFYNQPGVYLDNDAAGKIYQNFPAGNSVFTAHEYMQVIDALRDTDIEYGILPIPKYDAVQENFRTALSFPYSLYGIPKDAKNPSLSGAVMECLASESFRTVTPALFEIAMKTKYASDDVTGQMFDIIRASVIFDIGRIFDSDLGITGMFRSVVSSKNPDWASYIKSNEKVLLKKFQRLTDNLTQ